MFPYEGRTRGDSGLDSQVAKPGALVSLLYGRHPLDWSVKVAPQPAQRDQLATSHFPGRDRRREPRDVLFDARPQQDSGPTSRPGRPPCFLGAWGLGPSHPGRGLSKAVSPSVCS